MTVEEAMSAHARARFRAATWAEDALTAMTQNGRSVLAVAVAAEAGVGHSHSWREQLARRVLNRSLLS